jgi:site-specific DNA-adenine methylase
MDNYFGSKATSGLCLPIIAMIARHDTYIETHLGGGAIMRRKSPVLHNIAIDLDPKSLTAFDCDCPVEKVHGSAHQFLSTYAYHGRELVYYDPPYLHHTRSSKRLYRFDYEEPDHIELLKLLKGLPCSVMLSGYPSSLYDELLPDWRTIELQVMNQSGVRTEKLWFNFIPDRVQWPRYAGKNFTDRQRIKRKTENWGKRYQTLRRAERLAVLSSMMAVESGETV